MVGEGSQGRIGMGVGGKSNDNIQERTEIT